MVLSLGDLSSPDSGLAPKSRAKSIKRVDN